MGIMILLILMSQLRLQMEIKLELIQIDKLIPKIRLNNHKATIINSKIK
jgi:hypothetical protein